MGLLIAHLTFVLQLHTGIIIPMDDVDGRTIYSMPSEGIYHRTIKGDGDLKIKITFML